MQSYYVYILANQFNTVLYIGITGDLERRIREHKEGLIEGFTKRYHVHKLVYFEEFHDVKNAIRREKVLKQWSRKKKEVLIEHNNPLWNDLALELL